MNIKEKIRQSGIPQWRIAEYINVSEFTLSRWLRRPEKLNKEIKIEIASAIDNLKTKK